MVREEWTRMMGSLNATSCEAYYIRSSLVLVVVQILLLQVERIVCYRVKVHYTRRSANVVGVRLVEVLRPALRSLTLQDQWQPTITTQDWIFSLVSLRLSLASQYCKIAIKIVETRNYVLANSCLWIVIFPPRVLELVVECNAYWW